MAKEKVIIEMLCNIVKHPNVCVYNIDVNLPSFS